MKVGLFKKEIFAVSLFLWLLLGDTPIILSFAKAKLNNLRPQSSLAVLDQNELCDSARLVTVKVLKGNYWGSGVLIAKNGNIYSIVTNGHVLKENKNQYAIQTHDAKQYQAFVVERFDKKVTGNDLVLLQFDSSLNYDIATLNKWLFPAKVMAAGFPTHSYPQVADPQGFLCTRIGKVFRKLDEPMQNGYQLGYFISVHNGMSGGPLLNEQGKLVGINGMAEPAIFTNHDLYLYRDGRRVSESLEMQPEQALEKLTSASWAICSETIVELFSKVLRLELESE